MGKFYYNLYGGLNTELTPIKLGADTKKLYWADSLNIEPYKNQGITRQKGNQILLDLRSALSEYADAENPGFVPVELCPVPKDGKNFVLGLSDGRVFRFDASLGVLRLIYEFNVTPASYIFEYFLDGLVILPVDYPESAVDGIFYKYPTAENQAVNAISGGGEHNISALNFTNALGEHIKVGCACQYAGRLWLGHDNILYYSALGTFNDWTTAHDAGYIANFHSSTSKITALQGYGGSLAVYKNYEVFLLSGSDPESFAITKFADKGACGHKSVLTCNNKQYFFNNDGLFCLSMTGELNQIVMGANLASRISKMFEKLDTARISDTTMICRESKNQIWIFAPIQDETGKKEVWIYDYALDSWFIRQIPFEITGAATVCGEIYTLSSDNCGKIFLENKGNTFSSKPIKFSFSSPFFNFSRPTAEKIIEDFEVIFDGNSDNNFNFYISKDYMNSENTRPESISLESDDVMIWGGDDFEEVENPCSIWGGDDLEISWAKPHQECVKLDIFDALKSVQFHFEGDMPGQDLTIIGFEFKEVIYEE